MPETRFRIRWPDGRIVTCYSPSLVIKDYLATGESYALADFLDRSRTALSIASERVRAKYGWPCPRAVRELDRLEAIARAYTPDTYVKLESFEP